MSTDGSEGSKGEGDYKRRKAIKRGKRKKLCSLFFLRQLISIWTINKSRNLKVIYLHFKRSYVDMAFSKIIFNFNLLQLIIIGT